MGVNDPGGGVEAGDRGVDEAAGEIAGSVGGGVPGYYEAVMFAQSRCEKLKQGASPAGEMFSFGIGPTAWDVGVRSANAVPWEGRRKERKFNAKPGVEAFEMARVMAEENSSIRKLFGIKHDYYTRGFHLRGQAAEWAAESAEHAAFDWAGLASDLFAEYLATSNCVAFWMREREYRRGEGFPLVYVANTEDARWDDAKRWAPELQLKLRAVARAAAEDQQPGVLSPRVRQELAVASGSGFQLERVDDKPEEFGWAVGSSAKAGKGLGVPSLYSLLFDLSIEDNLRVGDWNSSHAGRNIIHHVKKGHSIDSGMLAGQGNHFLSNKHIGAIKEQFKGKAGVWRWITNFDVSMGYDHHDMAAYMSEKKWEAVRRRIMDWGGAPLRMMADQAVNNYLGKIFDNEIEAARKFVGRVLVQVMRHEDFIGDNLKTLEVDRLLGFDPLVTVSPEKMAEVVTTLQSRCGVSVRTIQEMWGFDPERERDRLKVEHEDPGSVAPAFEPAQGQLDAASSRSAGRRGGDGPPEQPGGGGN